MEWVWIVIGVMLAPLAWAMISRWRRGDASDEAYNGSSSDQALMEIGRQHHGQMR